MPRLTLRLLGPFAASLEGDQPIAFGYDKVRALCAYLAVEGDRIHPRSRLAALLWPEKSESAARHSLSQALSSLRASIHDRADEPALIQADRQTVRFDVDATCAIDLLDFQAIAGRIGTAADAAHCSLPELRRAVDLYRGPFLEGLALDDCPEFEDWQRAVQESTSQMYATALTALVQQLHARGDLAAACRYAERLVELDTWDEASHRLQMRLLAASGKRAEAIRQYEQCVEIIDRELGMEPEAETVELAQRIRSGLGGPLENDHPPSAPPGPPQSALPTTTTSIIGRDDEIEEITRQFSSGESRLVTLVGPGGIGKSRLALEVARARQTELADGVYFVGLTGVQSPELLASSILDAASAQVDPHGDPSDQLRAYVQPRELLLILDNFEHLLDAALLLNDLLNSAPGLQLLVTSRERLSLTSETVYQVEGLSLPELSDTPSIARSGATRLFMARARKHKTNFVPRREDAPAIARIARLTGGMPLALELAAAWIPVLSPDEIASEIERSLDFLTAEMRDLPERHRSVRAVVDRSWEHLSEVEQRTFRRLSVFTGGFTRAAANRVTGASLPVLSSLVSKSLLQHTNQGRYEIHELLRQYAAEQLANDTAEHNLVRDRFRDYYTGFVAVREEQLQGRAQLSVLADLTAETDNIRAAWDRAIDTHDYPGLGRAAHSLWLYYETIGRYREGTAAMQRAFEALDAVTDPEVRDSADYRFALARVRSRFASLGFRMFGPNAMLAQVSQGIELVESLDEPSELGLLLNFRAVAAHALGDAEQEERYLISSIEQFRIAGNRWGLAYSTNDLGHVRALQGDYQSARELHNQALAILEELGDRRGIAFVLRNLGIVARHSGDHDLAMQLLRRSVDVRRPIGNLWGIAESLNQIGVILRDNGHAAEAEQHFCEALEIAREIRAMQLAAEILKEYLPLLPERSAVRNVEVPPDPSGSRNGVLQEDGVSEISRLVDSVLGQSLSAAQSESVDATGD